MRASKERNETYEELMSRAGRRSPVIETEPPCMTAIVTVISDETQPDVPKPARSFATLARENNWHVRMTIARRESDDEVTSVGVHCLRQDAMRQESVSAWWAKTTDDKPASWDHARARRNHGATRHFLVGKAADAKAVLRSGVVHPQDDLSLRGGALLLRAELGAVLCEVSIGEGRRAVRIAPVPRGRREYLDHIHQYHADVELAHAEPHELWTSVDPEGISHSHSSRPFDALALDHDLEHVS